jgi:hypothetical protein
MLWKPTVGDFVGSLRFARRSLYSLWLLYDSQILTIAAIQRQIWSFHINRNGNM